MFTHRHVVMGQEDKASDAYPVLRIADLNPAASDTVLARFTLGDNAVVLYDATACRAPHMQLRLTFDVTTLNSPSSKFFRQAFAGEQKIASNDDEPVGGLVSFGELPAGKRIQDIAPFFASARADTMLFGIYDWQTGERWAAHKADGSQWPENAVRVTARGCED